MSRGHSYWWKFMGMLLLVAIWVRSTGWVAVHGLPLDVLESLARGKGLLTEFRTTTLDSLSWIGGLPGDSCRWSVAFMAFLSLGAAIMIGLVSRRIWKNSISSVLMIGFLFFGSNTMWAVTHSPLDSLQTLVLACAMAAVLSGSVPTLGGFVLAATAISPASGLALYPALAYLVYKRLQAYGVVVCSVTLFGVSCLLIPIAGPFRLEPSLLGLTAFTLFPVYFILFARRKFSARIGIYLSLLIGAVLSGTADLAAPIALADLAHYVLTVKPEPDEDKTSHQEVTKTWSVSIGLVTGVLATVLLVFGTLQGEQSLNREILIPAQKTKLPWTQMFGFFSLTQHADRFAQDTWRASIPFPDLKKSDIEAAGNLREQESSGFTVLTLSSIRESRQLSLLYALLSERPLHGWDDGEHLAGPLLLCKLRAQNFLSSGPDLIFRYADGHTQEPPHPKPRSVSDKQVSLEFSEAMALPYRIQTLSRLPGASYQWWSGPEEYILTFKDQPAEMILTERPGKVTVRSIHDPSVQKIFEVFPLGLEFSGLPSNAVWPSRSLIPITLTLTNHGRTPVSSELLSKIRIDTDPVMSFGPFDQKLSRRFILFPEESTRLTFQLATPEREGTFTIRTFAITPLGREIRVPLTGTEKFRTWRRLPP